ncbi:MAG: hypothetical protein ACT4P3_08145 [Betaproteobacteria bacterium]
MPAIQNWSLIVAAALLLSACAAATCLSYVVYPADGAVAPDLNGHQKFKLASPVILVEAAKNEKTSAVDVVFKTIAVEEPDGPTYAIVPGSTLWVVSRIGVATRPNSMLVQEVTTEIEDKRVEFIKELGGVVVSAIGVAAADRAIPPLGWRGVVDLAGALRAHKSSRQAGEVGSLAGTKIGSAPDQMNVVSVKLAAVSADAFERDKYPFGSRQTVFVYSACRDATFELSYKGTPYIYATRISDPNFVQTVGLPKTGKVSFHDQCGVSVTHGKAQTASSLELLKTTLDQVKSIREAQDKAEKAAARKK